MMAALIYGGFIMEMPTFEIVLADIKPELKVIVEKLLLKHGKAALMAAVEASPNKIDDVVASALLPAFEAEIKKQIEAL